MADRRDDPLAQYLQDVERIPRLAPEDQDRVARQAAAGDRVAREQLIEANLRLVVWQARRFVDAGVPLVDLLQEGTLGLIRAVDRFDPDRGVRFSTYAVYHVRDALACAVRRERAHRHGLPLGAVEGQRRLLRTQDDLAQALGREPTVAEVAAAAEVSPVDAERLLACARPTVSLDAPLEDQEGEILTMQDTIADPATAPVDEEALRRVLPAELAAGLPGLPFRIRRLVCRRLGWIGPAATRRDLALELNVSATRVGQLEQEALHRLRGSERLRALAAAWSK